MVSKFAFKWVNLYRYTKVVATQLLEGGARALEEDGDGDGPSRPVDDGKKSYVEEQADLKNAFLNAVSSDSDGDSDSDSGDESVGGCTS
jgi:protein KRI1